MSASVQSSTVRDNPTQEEIVSQRKSLPDSLKPPLPNEMHVGFRNGCRATKPFLPMKTVLPGLRTLRVGRFLQPPMLCYGWPVTIEDLVDIADSKGFLGAKTLDKTVPALSRIDFGDTDHLLHHVIRDELGIHSMIPEIRMILPKSKGRELIVCLCTTWNDVWDTADQNPPQEDVAKIAAHLGLRKRDAKWYMDCDDGMWAFRTFESIPVPRNWTWKYGMVCYEGVNEDGCLRCKDHPL
ncbi:hypothetical protein CPB84DRAFT_1959201 [Gymnopilus junonius]|uniref:Uncharacterized protein n=1 Tax=Gymnopilus junonius TaxID=109634 RepID=A0A9P5NY49_GYMJU|nr:hypothetical protein CPB84DRAFT_1959201 [Gymnopilus junonius]